MQVLIRAGWNAEISDESKIESFRSWICSHHNKTKFVEIFQQIQDFNLETLKHGVCGMKYGKLIRMLFTECQFNWAPAGIPRVCGPAWLFSFPGKFWTSFSCDCFVCACVCRYRPSYLDPCLCHLKTSLYTFNQFILQWFRIWRPVFYHDMMLLWLAVYLTGWPLGLCSGFPPQSLGSLTYTAGIKYSFFTVNS